MSRDIQEGQKEILAFLSLEFFPSFEDDPGITSKEPLFSLTILSQFFLSTWFASWVDSIAGDSLARPV